MTRISGTDVRISDISVSLCGPARTVAVGIEVGVEVGVEVGIEGVLELDGADPGM